MCVSYVHVYTYMHVCVLRMCVVCVYACMRLFMYRMYMNCVHVYVCVYTCIYVSVLCDVCLYMYVFIHLRMCVCMHMHSVGAIPSIAYLQPKQQHLRLVFR